MMSIRARFALVSLVSVTLALSLAFEPAEAGQMQRPPRDPKQPLLSPTLLWRVLVIGAPGCVDISIRQ